MSAADLWTAVVTSYDRPGLVALSNLNDRSASTINTTKGVDAAQAVINLWPSYAQVEYDADDPAHVEVAKQGVIALLWRRGGASTSIQKVKWADVFGPDGLIARIRRTDPRAHRGPSSNSGVSQKSELASGRRVRGWSDRDSLPHGQLPNRRVAD